MAVTRRFSCVRGGFTLIELAFVLVVVGVIIGLLLPATRSSREAARRMACSNNFKQIGLAIHNYHGAHQHLPAAMGGTADDGSGISGNANRLSGLVALLPYLEHQSAWEAISNPMEIDGVAYPAMGPVPWVSAYTPWRYDLPIYRCPSSPSEPNGFGMTSYTFCIGDLTREIHQPKVVRGMFSCRQTTRFHDVLDGLSNTIAMSEIGNPDSSGAVIGQFATMQPAGILDSPAICRELQDPDRPRFYTSTVLLGIQGRGSRWADGAAGFSLVNTVLPPNAPSCAVMGTQAVDGLYSAGSFHNSGGHVLMGDGNVKFITESIEAGDSTQPTLTTEAMVVAPTPSPFGLWGALGSANGKEELRDNF